MKVGMSGSQVAINQACGRAYADAYIKTQPQVVREWYNTSRTIDGILGPMTPLLTATWGTIVATPTTVRPPSTIAAVRPAPAAAPIQPAPTINWNQQAKHIPGHSGYLQGRSQLTADPEKLALRAGTGTPVGSAPRGEAGFRERINYGEKIGQYIDPEGNARPTSVAILHYKADGSIHIVPARPVQ
jgi:hypothetical protein